MGRLCYPTQAPGTYPRTPRQRGQKTVTVQEGYGTCFCHHGTNFITFWRDRGTSLVGAVNLSPVTKLVESTGAVSRYNADRSQKLVTVQDLWCGQVWVSGCKNHYKIVLRAGAKAKTVTNNLPILSVLYVGLILNCQVVI
jgi:hypothetical protein